MRSSVVRLGASRASVSDLMATSTQQRPAAAGRNPRSRGARDARRDAYDKLRADAHARPATSADPAGAGMITQRARELFAKGYFCELDGPPGIYADQAGHLFATSRLLRKARAAYDLPAAARDGSSRARPHRGGGRTNPAQIIPPEATSSPPRAASRADHGARPSLRPVALRASRDPSMQ